MIQVTGELRVSNDAFDDPSEIRRRMDQEGYLFFKGLQDKDKLMSLRKDMPPRLVIYIYMCKGRTTQILFWSDSISLRF